MFDELLERDPLESYGYTDPVKYRLHKDHRLPLRFSGHIDVLTQPQ